MEEKKRIKEVFDNWYYKGFSNTNIKDGSNGYSQTGLFNEYLKWRNFLDILNKNKLNLAECKILDAGCGNGNALRKLMEHGANPSNCYGIDISSDVIEFAKNNSPAGVNYQQGFIHRIGHARESFDVVFCLGVLIHILDDEYIREVTEEFYRVTKKNGIVIVLVSDSDIGANWGDLSSVTRNFSSSNKELENLFPKFDCIAVYRSYNDSYPPEIPLSDVLKYIETDNLKTAFKTYVFRLKEEVIA